MNLIADAKKQLLRAEERTRQLFTAVEAAGLIAPGKTESQLAAEIAGLAQEVFGIDQYWHKKIVRTGPNTLHSYSANPPDLLIQPGDILFIDFGPVVDGWEADFGRTYILGDDPAKLKIKRDVEAAWHEARSWYHQQTKLTGAGFFDYVSGLATRYGWEFGGEIAGHIVGQYPHEQLSPGDMGLDVHPDNHSDILQADPDGNTRHWILEIQFVDRVHNIGAYIEQLL